MSLNEPEDDPVLTGTIEDIVFGLRPRVNKDECIAIIGDVTDVIEGHNQHEIIVALGLLLIDVLRGEGEELTIN